MIGRVLNARAQDAARFASVIREQDPSWCSETFRLADGQVVLWGAGFYVNRAFGLGVDRPIDVDEFERLEARSAFVGVDAAIEMTPTTKPGLRLSAAARGYVRDGSVSAMRHRLNHVDELPIDASLVIETAARQLAVWQHTSAEGWANGAGASRRASDAYAAAAAVVDGDGFVLARDAGDGRPVGCASVTVNDGVATLGAMTTLPDERRRGVQAALIHHRLRLARRLDCDIAVTTAAPGGVSERNLLRHGFEAWFEIETHVRR